MILILCRVKIVPIKIEFQNLTGNVIKFARIKSALRIKKYNKFKKEF